MSEKCSVQSIRLRRLEDDVSSPALAALVNNGWQAIGSVVLDDGTEPVLHLIFAPPSNDTKSDWVLKVLLGAMSLSIASVAVAVWFS